MKRILLLLSVLLIKNLLYSNEIKYILQHLSQYSTLSDPIKICLDKDENIIVASTFTGTVDFDLTSSVYNLSPINNISSNYIAKYASNGKLIFAINFNSNSENRVADIITDADNNIYIIGDFVGTIDLDPGRGTTSFTSFTGSNVNYDIYLSKFSPTGRFLWGKRYGNSNWDYAEDIDIDKIGNIYFTATFRDNLTIGNTTISNNFNSTNTNYRSPYIVKLNKNGDLNWVRHNLTLNSVNYGKNISLVIDDTLNVYIAGLLWHSVYINYNISSNNLHSTGNGESYYVQKLDSTGNLKWVKVFPGKNSTSRFMFYGIKLDKKNNIFLVGEFKGKVDIDPSSDSLILFSKNNTLDGILIKLNPNGEILFHKTFGNDGNESLRSIDIRNNKIMLLGEFGNSFHYKINNTDSVVFNSNGLNGIFFLKFSDSLKYEYSNYFTHVGRNFNGSLRNANSFDILLNKKQNYYLTGLYATSFNFNLNKNNNNIITPGTHYFVKINTCKNSFDTITIKRCNNFKSPSNKYTWVNSGVYYDTLTNYMECDSIIKFNLTIVKKTEFSLNIQLCNNSYLSPSKKFIYTQNGLYFDTLVNTNGCDSIIKINLRIDTSTYASINTKSCKEITSPSGKYIYNSSGTYYDTLINHKGCDSIISIFFTKTNSSQSIININSCFAYQSPSRKYLWQNSGTYYDTVKNYLKCDSFITTNLFVYKNKLDTIDLHFCNFIKSPSRGRIWNKSGIYLDTFLNYLYCDSIVAYNLISNKSYSNLKIDACRQYTLPSGKKILQSGIYLDSIPNHFGCDSIIQFELTISQINNQVLSENGYLKSIEDSIEYQWYDCTKQIPLDSQNKQIFTPAKNGSYFVVLKKNNCYDTSDCIDFNELFLTNIIKTNINIYPSPASNFIILEIPFDLKPKQLNIYNSLSKNVKTINSNKNHHKIDFDFENGIYFIEVITQSNHKYFGKFLILN